MGKDMYMYRVIEDLLNESCERKGKLLFTIDELDYKTIKNTYDIASSDSDSEMMTSF